MIHLCSKVLAVTCQSPDSVVPIIMSGLPTWLLAQYRQHFPHYSALCSWFSHLRHWPVLTSFFKWNQTEDKKKPTSFYCPETIDWLIPVSESIHIMLLNLSFFLLCLCCGDRFEAPPSGWRPPSLLPCDAGDETWLTNFNKLSLCWWVARSACDGVWYAICIYPPRPGLIRQDRYAFTWCGKTCPALPSAVQMLPSQISMLLPDISFPAVIDSH